VLDQLAVLDSCDQAGLEHQHAVQPQHVRDEIVGEQGQALQVVEIRSW
jgi:hypothetical protein